MYIAPADRTVLDQRKKRRAGRPLRFRVTVMLLWASGRAMVIAGAGLGSMGGFPGSGAAAPLLAAADTPRAALAATAAMIASAIPPKGGYHGAITRQAPAAPAYRLDRIPIVTVDGEGMARQAILTIAIPAPSDTTRPSGPAFAAASPATTARTAASITVPPVGPPPSASKARRWSGSAWLLWRNRSDAPAISSAGQLGGAQAGLRIDRHLGRPLGLPPLSAYARLTSALHGPAAPEAALGFALHPLSGRVPVMIGVERRVALDRNGRDAFAILAATGLNPNEVIGGLIAEGYAQAGMVGFARGDLFADGRLTLTAPLDRTGRTGAGISLSGGAQPGISRLDVGPVLQTRLPLGAVSPRLSVEWRQRIAGKAHPGSGLAVTLASDF